MHVSVQPRALFVALLVSGGIGASCVDVAGPPPGAEAGDLVLWASGERSVEQMGAFVIGGAGRAAAVPTDALFWVLSKGRIVRAEGGATDLDWLEEVELVARGDPGGCGRCTSSMQADPLLVLSGDRCPIPSFLTNATSQRDRAHALAGQLEIAWPGPCGCLDEGREFDETSPPRLRRISPEAGMPSQLLASGAGGHVAGISNLGVWLRNPDGSVIRRESAPVSCDEAPTFTFDGVLRASAVSPSGETLVIEHPPGTGELRSRVHLLSRDLSERNFVDLEWVLGAAAFPRALGGDRLVLGGHDSSSGEEQAKLLACTLVTAPGAEVSTIECEDVPFPEIFRAAGGIRAIAEYDGRLLLLLETPSVTPNGPVFDLAVAEPGTPWTLRRLSGPAARALSEIGVPLELKLQRQLLIHGRTISVCAVAFYTPAPTVRREFGFVIDADLPERLDQSVVSPTWTPRLSLAHDCGAMLPGPGGRARILRVEAEELHLASILDPRSSSPESLSVTPQSVRYDDLNDRSLVHGRDGSLQVWENTLTSTEAYVTLIPGSTQPDEVFCPLEVRGLLLAVGSAGTLVEVLDPATGSTRLTTVPELIGVSACAYEATRDQVLIAGRGPNGMFLRWLDLARFASTEVELPVLPPDARMFRAVASAWGSVFLLGSEDLVLEVRGDQAVRLNLDWDDPNTESPEGEPEAGCCNFPSTEGRTRIAFDGIERPVRLLTDLDAHDGAVWIGGRGGAFFRAFPSGLERAAYQDAYLDLPSLRAECGDRAFVAQLGIALEFERGDLNRLARGPEGPWVLQPLERPTTYVDFSSGVPTSFFGDPKRLYTTFGRSSSGWGSLQAQGALERRLLPGPVLRGAATESGHVLISAVGGQLYLGAACR